MEFIEEIAMLTKKYAPKYEIKVISPIIAQAYLESANGNSELAVIAKNVFGIKYKTRRCPTACGHYKKTTYEQDANGNEKILFDCIFFKFKTIEDCVIGYFDFINIPRYNNLKGVKSYELYCDLLYKDGYATDIEYSNKLKNIIKRYNLTKYDKEMEIMCMEYTNSPLINYKRISPNKTSPRNHIIDTITIHCVVGQLSVESIADIFSKESRQASCNYCIGFDGRIGLVVEEKDRSWCSGNRENDHRAITIEIASDTYAPYKVNDVALQSLIKLLADICRRNKIKCLKWQNKKVLAGNIDEQNMTLHRWFQATSCPGDYLIDKHPYIVQEVNKLLGISDVIVEAPIYRVQTGAFSSLVNATKLFTQVRFKGFPAYIKKVNGLYKVQCGAFKVKANAEALQKQMKEKGFETYITKDFI